MKTTLLLKAASALVQNKKAKIIFVGLQFVFLTYQLLKSKKKKKQNPQIEK
jgi:hypothetical protein